MKRGLPVPASWRATREGPSTRNVTVAEIADSWEGRIALSALADVERLVGKGGAA